MIDDAGAAPAAAEPTSPPQDAVASDRSKETARASIDRAFAEIDSAAQRKREPKSGAPAEESPASAELQEADKPAADKAAAALSEAPARFSSDAKAAWASVPDSVRGEVQRAFRELESGLTQYQRLHEPLKPFYQLAEKNETTVEDALGRYVALDAQLASADNARKLSAIAEVLDYAGLTPQTYAGLMAEQKPGGTPPQSTPEIHELKAELAEMRKLIGGVGTSLRQSRESRIESEVTGVVEDFIKDHPRLNDAEFAKTVARLISTRMADDLASAYGMADRLIAAPPAVAPPAASTAANTPKPADQTRKGQLSIAGAPVSGSNPGHRRPAATARESLDRAFADMGFSG